MKLSQIDIHWLRGGVFELDGGTMFGAVPKSLWQRKLKPSDDNYIRFRNSPLLVMTPHANIVIDTGLGNKLSAKQKKIFRVSEDWDVPGSLGDTGLKREDISHVILTHCDFDHAGGIVMHDASGNAELTFPEAVHIVQASEWEDVMNPNIRSANTYWADNFKGLRDGASLQLVQGDAEISPGVKVIHTAGHTRGHQAVLMESKGEAALHMADLLPTHAHFNPLWLMAYDNFPLDAIERKQELNRLGLDNNAWFTFYHDITYQACRFDETGSIIESVRH